jgi:hypothetical protein
MLLSRFLTKQQLLDQPHPPNDSASHQSCNSWLFLFLLCVLLLLVKHSSQLPAFFVSTFMFSVRLLEGVLQAEKDFNLESHPEIEGVPNLHVIKLMQSFKSKELVTERFAWRHYYW